MTKTGVDLVQGRFARQLLHVVALGLTVLLLGRPACGSSAFATAELAPANASFFLEIEAPASLWKEVEGKPIAAWVERMLVTESVRASWRGVAERIGRSDRALFDALFAERCTLLTRDEEGGPEWTVILAVDGGQALQLLRKLRPRQLAPRHGVAVMAIPEQDVLAAVHGDRCIIAPRSQPALFDDVLARLSGESSEPGLLSNERCRALAESLNAESRPQVSAIIRHARPLGGATALIASVRAGGATVLVESDFENPPFSRRLTKLRWDCSKVDAFERHGLVTVVEPTDIGPGSFELFAQSLLNRPIISREMRTNLADTQILTIGEVEGRTESPPADMLTPTAAMALRMKDPLHAEVKLDAHIVELTRSINSLVQGACLVPLPDAARFEPGGMRHHDLSPVMNEFGGGFPVMPSISLNWCVAQTPSGSYYVIATHPEQLEEMLAALRRLEEDGSDVGRWASCGLAHGPRLSHHLRSLAEQAPRFTDPARPEDAEAFRSTLDLLALLGDGLDRARWKMERPSRERMRLEVSLELREPPSAEPPADRP